jgi:hypothetical protein
MVLLLTLKGITDFDLLGHFGKMEWLGSFKIILAYNLIFATATILCLVNHFTAPVRRELKLRLIMVRDGVLATVKLAGHWLTSHSTFGAAPVGYSALNTTTDDGEDGDDVGRARSRTASGDI